MKRAALAGALLALATQASAQAPAASGSAADRNAAFRAAGLTQTGGRWVGCEGSPAEIEVRDLNGDGRPDAVVTDSGIACYGRDEQGFRIVTKDANGAWKRLFENSGVPTFLTTRGAGGWPDIKNGGPGFCHAVLRWSGSDYVRVRWMAESPGACAGR